MVEDGAEFWRLDKGSIGLLPDSLKVIVVVWGGGGFPISIGLSQMVGGVRPSPKFATRQEYGIATPLGQSTRQRSILFSTLSSWCSDWHPVVNRLRDQVPSTRKPVMSSVTLRTLPVVKSGIY